jgi:hypothetical protein
VHSHKLLKKGEAMSINKSLLIFFVIVLAHCITKHITALSITQPIGILARTWETTGSLPFPVTPPAPVGFGPPTTPLEEVNYICAQWDSEVRPDTVPFDTRYPVTEIRLTQLQHFVRLLGLPTSSPNGAWIMRSEYVRGKTPQQLRDLFSLPRVPIDITNVEMPASPDLENGPWYTLWTGITGPIRDWGSGGTVQNRLVADFGTNYFPDYLYTNASTRNHRQPIGLYALSYRPLAGCGTTWNVANYLDSYIPIAYSDLEDVYHCLDYINYIPFGCKPLQQALWQISPERFDTFLKVNFRNSLLFGNAIVDRQLLYHQKNYCCDTDTAFKKCYTSRPFIGIEGIGEYDKFNIFHCLTKGLLCYIDVHPANNLFVGLSIGGMYNNLHCLCLNDKACGNAVRCGVYASYAPEAFFIDCILCSGFNKNKFIRSIEFYNVKRNAFSQPCGHDVEIHLQGGIPLLDLITPIVRLSYLFNEQNHVNECGASSLNLYIKKFHSHILRTGLGLQASHCFGNSQTNIIPHINMFCVTDIFINRLKIGANLLDLGGNFYALGPAHKIKSAFFGGLGCSFHWSNCWSFFVNYDAEVCTPLTAQLLKFGLEAQF